MPQKNKNKKSQNHKTQKKQPQGLQGLGQLRGPWWKQPLIHLEKLSTLYCSATPDFSSRGQI